jgi:hypothetical protein
VEELWLATHAIVGAPLKPLLHTPTQLLPAGMPAQLLGKLPLLMGTGGVPGHVGVTVMQAAMVTGERQKHTQQQRAVGQRSRTCRAAHK